jgi:transposase
MDGLFERWQLDTRQVRERMYRAPTARERERWHALWLVARGWSAAQVAEALERDPHTIGQWVAQFRRAGPGGVAFEQTGGTPPPSTGSSRPT